jgi:hypothetical protein
LLALIADVLHNFEDDKYLDEALYYVSKWESERMSQNKMDYQLPKYSLSQMRRQYPQDSENIEKIFRQIIMRFGPPNLSDDIQMLQLERMYNEGKLVFRKLNDDIHFLAVSIFNTTLNAYIPLYI